MRFQDKAKLVILLTCFWLAVSTIVHATLSLEDTWQRPDVDIEGFCYQPENTECGPYKAMSCDATPNRPLSYRTFVSAAACANYPSSCVATATNQTLRFHGADVYPGGHWEGFPMISHKTFSKDKYISVETRAKAYCGPQSTGCFFSLNIYNGESNYRGIAYVVDPNTSPMRIAIYGTCSNPAPVLLPSIAQGSFHTLRIDYYGHEGGKWVYFVDDVIRKIENVSNNTSMMQAHPRVALFFAGRQDGDYVEGEAGPLRVWTENNEDARQAIQG